MSFCSTSNRSNTTYTDEWVFLCNLIRNWAIFGRVRNVSSSLFSFCKAKCYMSFRVPSHNPKQILRTHTHTHTPTPSHTHTHKHLLTLTHTHTIKAEKTQYCVLGSYVRMLFCTWAYRHESTCGKIFMPRVLCAQTFWPGAYRTLGT